MAMQRGFGRRVLWGVLFALAGAGWLLTPARADDTPVIHTVIDNGTVHDICGPGGQAAFVVALDSHIRVTVYDSLAALEKTGGAARFQADPDQPQTQGTATIMDCGKKVSHCIAKPGMISITTTGQGVVTGMVQFLPAAWGRGSSFNENHTFQARYIPDGPMLDCKP